MTKQDRQDVLNGVMVEEELRYDPKTKRMTIVRRVHRAPAFIQITLPFELPHEDPTPKTR